MIKNDQANEIEEEMEKKEGRNKGEIKDQNKIKRVRKVRYKRTYKTPLSLSFYLSSSKPRMRSSKGKRRKR